MVAKAQFLKRCTKNEIKIRRKYIYTTSCQFIFSRFLIHSKKKKIFSARILSQSFSVSFYFILFFVFFSLSSREKKIRKYFCEFFTCVRFNDSNIMCRIFLRFVFFFLWHTNKHIHRQFIRFIRSRQQKEKRCVSLSVSVCWNILDFLRIFLRFECTHRRRREK